MASRRKAAITFVPGRDIAALLSPEPGRRQPLKGFDADYVDLPDYIIRCTHRIWEEKRLDLIPTHYAKNAVIHTLAGDLRGADTVVANTAKTLAAFPDRTLYGDHVIWSGDDAAGFYSSHRITSHMSNRGASEFGPATGRRATVVTIADCVVKANRIVEEWLVRDNLGLVLQLGLDPHHIARAQAGRSTAAIRKTRAAEHKRVRALRRGHKMAEWSKDPGRFAAAAFSSIWNDRAFGRVRELYADSAVLRGPSGRDLLGHGEIIGFVGALLGAVPDAQVAVDHIAVTSENARTDVALRWTLAGTHAGQGLYGPATGRPLLILACTHWSFRDGRIVEDWTVFDELAVLTQVYGG